jgi:hypothetical protein
MSCIANCSNLGYKPETPIAVALERHGERAIRLQMTPKVAKLWRRAVKHRTSTAGSRH